MSDENEKKNLNELTFEELQKLLDNLEKQIEELEESINKYKRDNATLLIALKSIGILAHKHGASIDSCPVCFSPVILNNFRAGDSVYCTNPNCECHISNKLTIGPSGRLIIK